MNRYSRRPGRGKAAGFSLIEVMVAVLVLHSVQVLTQCTAVTRKVLLPL